MNARYAYNHGDRPKSKKNPVLQEIWEWTKALLIALVITLLIRTFLFDFVRVDGPSMQPTLYTGERLFINRLVHWTGSYERGNVVICHFPERKGLFVKRLIASAGERVRITDGVVYVNDVPLDEKSYILEPADADFGEITVPEGHIFVMGDNRNDSTDSRNSLVGCIELKRVRGVAVQIVYPFDRWEKLTVPAY